MPPQLALVAGAVFILLAFRAEKIRGAPVSSALFWPFLWYFVCSSRPLGLWLLTLGVPLPGGSGDATEGSIIDRAFYGVLALIGIRILRRRNINLGEVLGENPLLTAFVVYMCVSIVWSDYPLVSLKRFIKLLGAIVMALVVLTDGHRMEAIAAVIRRSAYIHIPLSIVVIKYYRELGVSWDWFGVNVSWQGIATSKNTLGQVAMTSALCFIWERARHWHTQSWRTHKFVLVDYAYIAMSVFLLKGSDGAVSLTSLSVFSLGLLLFIVLGKLKSNPVLAARFSALVFAGVLGLLALVVWHSVSPFAPDSLFGLVITKFGRDLTLTGRTEIWHDVYEVASQSPLLGVGFGAFWIGRVANIPWCEDKTWALGQGHNGYVDTYLHLGGVGVVFLLLLLFLSFRRLQKSLEDTFEYARFGLMFLLVISFVNITESSFLRGDHNLWFLFLLTMLVVPQVELATEPNSDVVEDAETSLTEGDEALSTPG